MSVAESVETTRVSLIDQVRIITEREGGLVEAYVPIDLINQEEVAYDAAHVVELAESIKKESSKQQTTGQLSPVLIAAVPDMDKFVIIDGFHRTPALASLGKTEVYATIKPDCTWEDVVDLRIVAAKSHKSVKFSRIVDWVEEAWTRTSWADTISVSRAFQLYFLKQNSGSRAGLTPEDAEAVREWVGQKCEQWGISAPAIDGYLRTARLADPNLVQTARERTSGHKLEVVTPKHLAQIARYLPDNYPMQNLVAEAAVDNALTIPEAKVLAIIVSRAESEEQAKEFVTNKAWRRMDTASRNLTKKRYPNIDPKSPEQFNSVLMDKFFDDQVAIAGLLIENAVLAGVYKPHLEEQNGRMNSLAAEIDEVVTVEDNPFEELPEGSEESWAPESIASVAEKTIAFEGTFLNVIRGRYSIQKHDGEDVLSVARMRLIQKIQEGKFPEGLAIDNTHLQRLFMKFVTYAAVDHIRGELGRQGQKQRPLSLDAPTVEGDNLTLLDNIRDTRAEDALVIDNSNVDFIKTLLPLLNERERRVLVLMGYYELKYPDIALILGTTAPTIAQTFKVIKSKTAKFAEVEQA